MAFAITQNCCSDASCVSVCPVNCIHPTPDEPEHQWPGVWADQAPLLCLLHDGDLAHQHADGVLDRHRVQRGVIGVQHQYSVHRPSLHPAWTFELSWTCNRFRHVLGMKKPSSGTLDG